MIPAAARPTCSAEKRILFSVARILEECQGNQQPAMIVFREQNGSLREMGWFRGRDGEGFYELKQVPE